MRAALRRENQRFAMLVRRQSLQNNAVFLLVTGVAFQNVPAVAGISVFETFFLIAALMLGLASSGGRMRFRPIPVTSWFFFTLGAFALSAIVTETPRYLLTMTFTLSSGVLALLASDAEPRAAVRGALLSGLVLALTVIGQRYGLVPVFSFSRVSFSGSDLPGYTGLIPSRGSFGIALMTSLSIALASIFQPRRWVVSVLALGLIGMMGLAVMMSLSRSTMVAYLLALASFAFLQLSSKRLAFVGAGWIRAAYFIVPGLAMVLAWLLFSGVFADLVGLIIDARRASVENRLSNAAAGLEYYWDAWLLGTGTAVRDELSHLIHNAYLAVLVERGIFSFVGFAMLNLNVFFVLVGQLRLAAPDRRPVWSALLAGFLGVQVELMFFLGYMSIPYWVFLAIVVIFLNHSTNLRLDAAARVPPSPSVAQQGASPPSRPA